MANESDRILPSGTFGCVKEELQELVENRGHESIQVLGDTFGGLTGLCRHLNTSPNHGLSDGPDDLKVRRLYFGSNCENLHQKTNIYRLLIQSILAAVWDFTLIILIIDGVLSLVFFGSGMVSPDSIIHGIIILVAVFVIICVDVFIRCFWVNLKDKHRLETTLVDTFPTVRNGEHLQVPLSDIVVGDVCFLKAGDVIPVDGILIDGNGMKVNESALTGESEDVVKGAEQDLVLLAGTIVTQGSGRMVVVAVGCYRQMSITSNTLSIDTGNRYCCCKSSEEKLRLRLTLEKMVKFMRIAGVILAVLAVVILIMRFCIETFAINRKSWSVYYVNHFVRFLLMGFPVLVAAAPYGILSAGSLAFTQSIRGMLDNGFRFRKIDILERVCSVTTLCFCYDIGHSALTTSELSVHECVMGDVHHRGSIRYSDILQTQRDFLLQFASVLKAYLNSKQDQVMHSLLNFFKQEDTTLTDIPTENIHPAQVKDAHSIGVLQSSGVYRFFIIGRVEILLKKCSHILDGAGQSRILSNSDQNQLMATVVHPMESEGLHGVCISYVDLTSIKEHLDMDQLSEAGLTCACILAIEDPIGKDVNAHIKKFKQADFDIRYVTDDSVTLAESIAVKCGILQPEDKKSVLDVNDFRNITDTEEVCSEDKISPPEDVLKKSKVLVHSPPSYTHRWVKALTDGVVTGKHEVVAFIGSRTGAAPALNQAEVGIALGHAATGVAKEAADIVLPDDKIASVMQVFQLIHHMFISVERVILFQLTVNLVASVVTFLSAISVVYYFEIAIIQLIWINLIVTKLLCLCLVLDQQDADLNVKPSACLNHLQLYHVLHILGYSVYQIAVMFWIIFAGHSILNEDYNIINTHLNSQVRTMTFNTFTLLTLFNAVNMRTSPAQRNVFFGLQKNLWMMGILGAALIIQIVIVQAGGAIFGTSPLTLEQWMWCVFFAVGTLLWGQLMRCIPEINAGPLCSKQSTADIIEMQDI